jgi:hypothetical protein
MALDFKYAFDDEPVAKFCFDLVNKRIDVQFAAYYDADDYIERPAVFIIENWKDAKSKIATEEKWHDVNKHMGIFTIIYYMQFKDESMEIFVNTVDNRYITLLFTDPILRLENI